MKSLGETVKMTNIFLRHIPLKEAEQKRLESEMQKRRERIEKWRADRKQAQAGQPITITMPTKKWSLEDDEDDDDPDSSSQNSNDEDEVDPLDAFMAVSYQ